jgi:hypothetical protein
VEQCDGIAVGSRSLGAHARHSCTALRPFSAWCLLNFWRCREAHCIVTGTGWAALAVLIAIELAAGRTFVLGSEGLMFLAMFIVGAGFEMLWRLRHGTNALVRDH